MVYNDVATLFMLNVMSSSHVQELESYLKGVIDWSNILDVWVYYHDPIPKVLVLNNSVRIAFYTLTLIGRGISWCAAQSIVK